MRRVQVRTRFRWAAVIGVSAALLAGSAWADGTETLGVPGEALLLDGAGFVAAGTGLETQPNSIEIDVPAGVTVNQVLLYWAGERRVAPGDTIQVNGAPVVGTLIGGPTLFFDFGGPVQTASYRADITALNAVAPGPNTVTLDGLGFDWANSGAGIVVLYDDGVTPADTQIVDGIDVAYWQFPDPRRATIPQTFTFEPAEADRVAKLGVFVGAVTPNSPHTIDITVGGTTQTLVDPLGSLDGPTWDTLLVPVDIPAGESEVTVQIHSTPSTDPVAASLLWVAAAFAVPLAIPDGGDDCVVCEGGLTSVTLRNDNASKQYIRAHGVVGNTLKTFFQGWVNAGAEFTVAASNTNQRLPAFLLLQYGYRITLVRTDCAWEIGPGARFEKFTVLAALNVGGEPVCPLEDREDLCDEGRPKKLTLRYNGASCGDDDFSFSPLYMCQGDPESDNRVYIIATSDLNPFSPHTVRWFKGNVNLGSTFTIDAGSAGRPRLGVWTWITVYDKNPAQGGHRLQRVAVRTSCTQPIYADAEFGAFELVSYVAD